jgi:hypothetical protein
VTIATLPSRTFAVIAAALSLSGTERSASSAVVRIWS